MFFSRTILVLVFLCLAACATKPVPKSVTTSYSADGQVQDQTYVPDDSSHYPEIPGAVYLKIEAGPANAMPEYPEQLLSKKLPPVLVQTKVIVNANGSVDSAEIIDGDWYDPAFQAATLKAVRQWHFTPLRRVVDGKTEFLPTTEHFLFLFSQVNGKAIVRPGS